MKAGTPAEARKLHQIPGNLESQVIVSHPVWVLGSELRSSGKAKSPLKHTAISPAPELAFLWGCGLRLGLSVKPWLSQQFYLYFPNYELHTWALKLLDWCNTVQWQRILLGSEQYVLPVCHWAAPRPGCAWQCAGQGACWVPPPRLSVSLIYFRLSPGCGLLFDDSQKMPVPVLLRESCPHPPVMLP